MNIEKIFNGFLSNETIDKINLNYEKYKDVDLLNLGVDSLDIMGIVFSIEEHYKKEINFETFDIDEIKTLEKIKNFINK